MLGDGLALAEGVGKQHAAPFALDEADPMEDVLLRALPEAGQLPYPVPFRSSLQLIQVRHSELAVQPDRGARPYLRHPHHLGQPGRERSPELVQVLGAAGLGHLFDLLGYALPYPGNVLQSALLDQQ